MSEKLMLFYKDFKEFYSPYVMLMILIIGLYCLLVDYKTLKDKKLKKEAKLCKFIGIFYTAGSIGLFILLKIF